MQQCELTNGRVSAEPAEMPEAAAVRNGVVVPAAAPQSLRRLNIGCGNHKLPGYENWDRKSGQECFPLATDDGSCEEIRASHVLEHFSHRHVFTVVEHWVSKLAPGGVLKIAVPDFDWIAQKHLDGNEVNVMRYAMGGHVDEDDWHGALFEKDCLTDILVNAGLERIGKWSDNLGDTSSLPCSLNLQGFKPVTDHAKTSGVVAVLSAPRFGPLLHTRFVGNALAKAGIPYSIGQGAYWHQILCEAMETALQRPGAEYILTLDYDSIFRHEEVTELYRLMQAYPEFDAICPPQSHRGRDHALFHMRDKNGQHREQVSSLEFERNVTPISAGHFGCTLFRAESLQKLPRPWMMPRPAEDGTWGDGHVDADMDFWDRFAAAGLKLGLANKVPVGHLVEVIAWPGPDFKTVYQSVTDFEENGVPAGVKR